MRKLQLNLNFTIWTDQSCCRCEGEICQFERLILKIFLVKLLGLLWPVVAANQRLSDGADCVSRKHTMAMLGRLMLIISARCCRRKITTSFLYNLLVAAIVRPPCRGHHRPQQINKEQQPLGHVLSGKNEFFFTWSIGQRRSSRISAPETLAKQKLHDIFFGKCQQTGRIGGATSALSHFTGATTMQQQSVAIVANIYRRDTCYCTSCLMYNNELCPIG